MIDLENDFESKEILVYRKIALKEIEIEQSHRPQVYLYFFLSLLHIYRVMYLYGHGLLEVPILLITMKKMNGTGLKK